MEKHWKDKNEKVWTEEEVTDLIMKEVGRDVYRPTGFNLLIKLYKKPEKTAGGIILLEDSRLPDKSYSRIGQVLAMGKYAYKGDKFHEGAYCNIGDYVTFRQFEWEDVPMKENELVNVPCNMITGICHAPEDFIV
jgi:co-chaperonin GroES (HSP10)